MTERRSTLLACGLFACVAVLQFHDVWSAGPYHAIAAPRAAPPQAEASPERFDHLWSPYLGALRKHWEQPDHAFALWVVSHDARALLGREALFGPGQCFPFAKPLGLGHPALTQGILAAPALLLLGDPIAAYNAMLFATTWLAALAMFWVVRDWTASPAAGFAAGLLFAFHGAWTSLATYPFIIDLAWTLLALHFAERALDTGRPRNALAAAVCVALQLWTSLDAALVSGLVLAPYAVWSLSRRGLGRLRPAALLAAAAVVALAAGALAVSYLDISSHSEVRPRFAAMWSGFLPGGYVGWLTLLLAAAAFVPGAAEPRAGRRWPLLASCLLVMWLATGGNQEAARLAGRGQSLPLPLPDPYRLLAFLPGIDLVRGPAWLASGVHLGLALLAGLGVARLLSWVPGQRRAWAGVLLCCVVGVDTLRPEWWGDRAPSAFSAVPLRPADAHLDFFAEIEALDPDGAFLEVPVVEKVKLRASEAARLVHHVYHRRPTSSCHNSVIPEVTDRVRALAARLPDADALRELRAMGFTTLIVHGPTAMRRHIAGPAVETGALVPLRSAALVAAYAIR